MNSRNDKPEDVDELLDIARGKLQEFEDSVDHARLLLRLKTASPAHPLLLFRFLFGLGFVTCIVTMLSVLIIPLVSPELARTIRRLDEAVPFDTPIAALPAVLGFLALCMVIGMLTATLAARSVGRDTQMLPWEQKEHQKLVNEVTRLTTQKAVMERIKNTPPGARPRLAMPVPGLGPNSGGFSSGGGFTKPSSQSSGGFGQASGFAQPTSGGGFGGTPQQQGGFGGFPQGGFGQANPGSPATGGFASGHNTPSNQGGDAGGFGLGSFGSGSSGGPSSSGQGSFGGPPSNSFAPQGPAQEPQQSGGFGASVQGAFTSSPSTPSNPTASGFGASQPTGGFASPPQGGAFAGQAGGFGGGGQSSGGFGSADHSSPMRNQPNQGAAGAHSGGFGSNQAGFGATQGGGFDSAQGASFGGQPNGFSAAETNPSGRFNAPSPNVPTTPEPSFNSSTGFRHSSSWGDEEVEEEDEPTEFDFVEEEAPRAGGVRLGAVKVSKARVPTPQDDPFMIAGDIVEVTKPSIMAPAPTQAIPTQPVATFEPPESKVRAARAPAPKAPGPRTRPSPKAKPLHRAPKAAIPTAKSRPRIKPAAPKTATPLQADPGGILSRARMGVNASRATPYGSAGRVRPNPLGRKTSGGTPLGAAPRKGAGLSKSAFGTPPPIGRAASPPTPKLQYTAPAGEDEVTVMDLGFGDNSTSSVVEPWLTETLARMEKLVGSYPPQAHIQCNQEDFLPFTLIIARATPAMAVRAMAAYIEFLAAIPTPRMGRVELVNVANLDRTFHKNVQATLKRHFKTGFLVERNPGQVDIQFENADARWDNQPRVPVEEA